MNEFKNTAVEWVDSQAEHIAAVSRAIWEYAEVGLTEFKSSDTLVDELERNGFSVERGQAGMPTAFIGSFSQGTGQPVIGFLAEYDALPNGHSCGHNLFGAGSVAAAIAAKEAMVKHGIDGTLKLFGTPTEDTHGGKVWMVREKCFDGCDAIVSWHPGSRNISRYGSNLAVQILEVDFHGRSAHAGAAPEKGRSALDGLMIASMAAEFLREHMIDPMRIHYHVSSGGLAPNIVPDFAQMRMAVRGPTMADVEYLRSRDGGIDDCIRAGALGSGTDATIKVRGAFYNQIHNEAGAWLMYDNMKAVGAPQFTAEEKARLGPLSEKYGIELEKLDEHIYEPQTERAMGSADTGDVSHVAPVITMSATCDATGSPGHHLINVEQYGSSIGHKGLVFASKVLACAALDLLTDEERLQTIIEEYRENLKGADYHAVIPADVWPPIPAENPADFRGPAPEDKPAPKPPESVLYWKRTD